MPAILEIDGYELVIPLSKINFFSENDSDNDDQNIIYYMIYPKLKSVTKKFNKLSISSENKSKQSEQTWDHESDSDTDTKLDDDSEESSD